MKIADQAVATPLALGRRLLSLPPEQLRRELAQATPDDLAAFEVASAAVAAQAQAISWLRDPLGWADACVVGDLTPYQRRDLAELATGGRLAVRSPHGVGKTVMASLAILWFATTREAAGIDWKIPTTASVWRQLVHYLWPNVHAWARRLKWDALGRPPFTAHELQVTRLKLLFGEAWAMAAHDPAAIEGAHATHLLYVFDEAKAIPDAVWDAAEGAFSGAGADTGQEAWALAISTPGEPAGRFYEIHRRAHGLEQWGVSHVTLADAVAAKRVSREWAENMARLWPRGSAVYATRVLGEFASSAANNVVPLGWVEAANDRWWAMLEAGGLPAATHVGLDVAREGDDDTVIISVAGDFVGRPVRPGHGDTLFTATAALPYTGIGPHGPLVVVDADGIGAGVFDQLRAYRDLGPRVHAFHAGTRAEVVEGQPFLDLTGQLHFANKRSAAWWHVRDLLDPRNGPGLALPPDDLLTGDLTAPRFRYVGDRIQVESKDDIRKRIGRSTDTGDALVMGLWGRLLQVAGIILAADHDPHTAAPITAGLLDMQM